MKFAWRSTSSRVAIEREKFVGCRKKNKEYNVRGINSLFH
jgi:hypothetical protein